MERPSDPVRRFPRRGVPVAVAAALALLLVGCGRNTAVGRSAVATVNGTDISASRVHDLVDAQLALGRALESSKKVDPAEGTALLTEFRGAGNDTFTTRGAASVVSSLVDLEIARTALADQGTKVTKADRAAARATITGQLKSAGIDAKDDGVTVLLDFEVERIATERALGKKLVQLPEQLCVEVIGNEAKDKAQEAVTRLQGGEDFNAVATDLSVQPPTGNPAQDVQCITRAQFASVFPDSGAAKAGDLLGPVQSPAQASPDPSQPPPPQLWLVARVQRVKRITVAEVEAQIAQTSDESAKQSASQSLEQALAQAVAQPLQAAYRKADVTVDRRYGTWRPKLGVVEPPATPNGPAPPVPAAAADGQPAPIPEQSPGSPGSPGSPAPAPAGG